MSERIARIAAIVVTVGLMVGAARPTDLSQAVILVASQDLDGSPFQRTIVIAASMPNGGHIGFIVNRPTTVTLQAIFPEQTPARNVKDPVYLGGPTLANGVFG